MRGGDAGERTARLDASDCDGAAVAVGMGIKAGRSALSEGSGGGKCGPTPRGGSDVGRGPGEKMDENADSNSDNARGRF